MLKRVRLQLKEYMRERRFVRFARPFEATDIRGYIVDIGPKFFLLRLVSDRIKYDGYECFRIADVSSLRPDPFADFVELALKKRREQFGPKPPVMLDGIKELLLSAAQAFPLVTIHREEVDPDACWIGKLTGISRGRASLLEIGPDAIWEASPTAYRLGEITRVNFGGDYEGALYLVGGDPPSDDGE
jgi:hypothetical protein